MSRLQILITQYKETEEIVKNILDSIEIQQNIDLQNDIEIIIGNDGSEVKLTESFLKNYSFPIQYHFFDHSRLAGCRKHLFDISTADYIMFCDADDMFSSNTAIFEIFELIDKGFDVLTSVFYRENKFNEKITYQLCEKDTTHIHGKVYNRNFLVQNKIIWHEELYEHQDSPYNILALTLSKNTVRIPRPIYIWKWYDNSVSHLNGDMHKPMTWVHLIDAVDYLVNDLMIRGFGLDARYFAMYCLYYTYYEMSNAVWYLPESEDYKTATYKRLVAFFKKYELLLLYETNEKDIQEIKTSCEHIYKNDIANNSLLKLPVIEEWMQSILNLFL